MDTKYKKVLTDALQEQIRIKQYEIDVLKTELDKIISED